MYHPTSQSLGIAFAVICESLSLSRPETTTIDSIIHLSYPIPAIDDFTRWISAQRKSMEATSSTPRRVRISTIRPRLERDYL